MLMSLACLLIVKVKCQQQTKQIKITKLYLTVHGVCQTSRTHIDGCICRRLKFAIV